MLSKTTQQYRRVQFQQLKPHCSVYRHKIKIIGPDNSQSKTNWIDVSDVELKQIKMLLLGEENNGQK